MNYLMIFIGGGLGSMLRYALSRFNQHDSAGWFTTTGTFAANMISCLILGALISYDSKNDLGLSGKLLLLTGFCGGFSTFSTFSYEILQYIQKGQTGIGVLYLIASVIISLGFIVLGMKIFN